MRLYRITLGYLILDRGALGWLCLAELLDLWDTLNNWNLNSSDDAHLWKFEGSGIFSTKLDRPTGNFLFVLSPSSQRLWKSLVPVSAKLMAGNSKLLLDSRPTAKGGPSSSKTMPPLRQADETVHHSWRSNYSAKWWRTSWKKVQSNIKKCFNDTLCILGVWTMWKYCNGCVQWGAPKYAAIQVYKDIGHTIMGAKGLAALGLGRLIHI